MIFLSALSILTKIAVIPGFLPLTGPVCNFYWLSMEPTSFYLGRISALVSSLTLQFSAHHGGGSKLNLTSWDLEITKVSNTKSSICWPDKLFLLLYLCLPLHTIHSPHIFGKITPKHFSLMLLELLWIPM